MDTTRRQLLALSGATLGAAGLAACARQLGVLPPAEAARQAQALGRREQAAIDRPLLRALATAVLAPSPHNTQPWKVRLLDAETALLFVDERRLLPVTDPPARQIHLGCGCYCEAFAMGANTLGRAAEITWFPDGDYAGFSDIGRKPVALLALGAEDAAEPLAAFVGSRQTSRLVYDGPYLGRDELGALVQRARPAASALMTVHEDAMAPYLALFDRAFVRELETFAASEETRAWWRFSDDEASSERDGLTFEGAGLTGWTARFARWFTDDTAESWNDPGTLSEGIKHFRRGLYSARGLVLQSTSANGFRDQLAAGRDTYRFMLALTEAGLFAHPMNQVQQEYAEMTDLRRELERLTGIGEPGKVQMIFRVGRGATPYLSYRRRLNDLIV